MCCLKVARPVSADARFDIDYHVTKHMPLIMSLIGAAAVRFEVAKGLAVEGGTPAPFVAVGQVCLGNLEGMEAAFARHLPTILADIAKYMNIAPVVNVEALLT